MVGTEGPLKLVMIESPLEMVRTKSRLKLVGTESSLELVRTESLLRAVGTESSLEVVGIESPLELVGTKSPLGVVAIESSLELVRTKNPLGVEQFSLQAPLVAIENLVIGDLYVELIATFDLKRHTCSNLAVEDIIYVTHIDENDDGLLFKKSSNFHCLWVGVGGQCVHCIAGWLGLFLRGFIFAFEAFFRWFIVLILY
ncbi:hypothetical protein BHM03_00045926 [Ensete ventricosum]|nr:hypothetical protein BHM03_00045926 [Ensete ventricosum]